MADETIKQKARRAKKAAIEKCEEMGYKIIVSDNSVFCFLASRKTEIRMIRVVMHKISEDDIQKIGEFESPETCSKEIWRRRDDGGFEIREVAR
jgi:hypothetical protein